MMKPLVDELFSDPELRRALAGHVSESEFAREAARLSRLSLRAEDVLGDLRSRRQQAPAEACIRTTLPADISGWYPWRTWWQEGELRLDWIHVADHSFDQPFYEQALVAARGWVINRYLTFSAPLAALANSRWDPVEPDLIIFHVSRCGSTLLCRALNQLRGSRVISEPPPVDAVLRCRVGNPAIPEHTADQALSNLVTALGQAKESGRHALYAVKLDCWDLFAFDRIRGLFPNATPLLIYRDPYEVLASHRLAAGSLVVPGMIEPEWMGATGAEADEQLARSFEHYGAWAIRRIFREAASVADRAGVVVIDYRTLALGAWEDILERLGLRVSADEIDKIRESLKYHAKSVDRRHDVQTETAARSPLIERLKKQFPELAQVTPIGGRSP